MSLLNARTIPYSTESIESMAATIKSVGLLQNLVPTNCRTVNWRWLQAANASPL